jgi:hypothetical protein
MTEDITKDGDDAEVFAAAAITGINVARTVSLVFDGTTETKTLEVKLVQDLTSIFTYAEAHWTALSETVKSALDLGQPGKVFVNASYSGSVYTIYGTSYHPGWAKESALKGESSMWGSNDRNMYMFKVKASGGTDGGAKMAIALPLATESDVSNVWTKDSLATIFSGMMLNNLNTMLAKRADDVDDADTDGSNGSNQSLEQEKMGGAYMMRWFLNNSELNTKFTYDAINSWLVTHRGADAYVLSAAELKNFIDSDSTDANAVQVKNAYSSIKYMINPAFYDEEDGFIGTYDEVSDVFYNYTNGTMTEGAKPASFSTLNAFDLSTITPYVPADVVAATLTVK